MSDLSSAFLILIMFLSIVGLLTIAAFLFITCIAIVETTALTKRTLRKASKKSDNLNSNIEDLVSKWITDPIDRIDRARDWLVATTADVKSSHKQNPE